jgi:hypothetical protein
MERMDMSKLSASDRRILITAVIVVLGGIVGIVDRWGLFAIIGGLAGLGAVLVVLQPQLMPTMQMPVPKATALLVLGVVAALGFVIAALGYVSYVLDVMRIMSILFDIGLIASIALAYFAWMEYQGSMGSAGAAASAPPPPPPAAEPPAAE